MANKFSKSIMDRLELEARQQKSSCGPESGGDKGSPLVEERASSQLPRELPELSRYLHSFPRRRAKGKTFYLDEELIGALDRVATEKSMSESRLVNDILRSVLGI